MLFRRTARIAAFLSILALFAAPAAAEAPIPAGAKMVARSRRQAWPASERASLRRHAELHAGPGNLDPAGAERRQLRGKGFRARLRAFHRAYGVPLDEAGAGWRRSTTASRPSESRSAATRMRSPASSIRSTGSTFRPTTWRRSGPVLTWMRDAADGILLHPGRDRRRARRRHRRKAGRREPGVRDAGARLAFPGAGPSLGRPQSGRDDREPARRHSGRAPGILRPLVPPRKRDAGDQRRRSGGRARARSDRGVRELERPRHGRGPAGSRRLRRIGRSMRSACRDRLFPAASAPAGCRRPISTVRRRSSGSGARSTRNCGPRSSTKGSADLASSDNSPLLGAGTTVNREIPDSMIACMIVAPADGRWQAALTVGPERVSPLRRGRADPAGSRHFDREYALGASRPDQAYRNPRIFDFGRPDRRRRV